MECETDCRLLETIARFATLTYVRYGPLPGVDRPGASATFVVLVATPAWGTVFLLIGVQWIGRTFMNTLRNKSTIPLDHAVLCLDCNCVSDANRECPACSSRALMNLSVVLNRPTEFVEYARLANAA